MDFNQIKQQGYWKDTAEALNDNFNRVGAEIDKLQEKTDKAKGLFSSLGNLQTAYPNPVDGDWAYVGTTFPAKIYIAQEGAWVDSGGTGGTEIPLTEYLQSAKVTDLTEILS